MSMFCGLPVADSRALMPVTAASSRRGVCASRTVYAPAVRKKAACAR